MNLTDAFGSVYIINLARRPDRKAALLANLAATGLADPAKLIFLPAADGLQITLPPRWRLSPGTWGGILSHLACLDHAAARGTSCCILEDDCFFLPASLPRFQAFLQAAPVDWGQLYLGGEHRHPFQPTAVPGVVRCISTQRTHAYVTAASHTATVAAWVRAMPATAPRAIDNRIEQAHRKALWPVYAPRYWLAGQAAGLSDLSGRTHPARLWGRAL